MAARRHGVLLVLCREATRAEAGPHALEDFGRLSRGVEQVADSTLVDPRTTRKIGSELNLFIDLGLWPVA